MHECVCECVCTHVCVCACVCVCTGETGKRVHYFTPTELACDLQSMHEEEYCNTHYTNSR